jgi:hypothetical protein
MFTWVSSRTTNSKAKAFTNGKMAALMKDSSYRVSARVEECGRVQTETNFKVSTLEISKMAGVDLPGPTEKSTRDSSRTISDMERAPTGTQAARSASLCGKRARSTTGSTVESRNSTEAAR